MLMLMFMALLGRWHQHTTLPSDDEDFALYVHGGPPLPATPAPCPPFAFVFSPFFFFLVPLGAWLVILASQLANIHRDWTGLDIHISVFHPC